MKFLVILAAFVVVCGAQTQVSQEQRKVWDALRDLRGGKDITAEEAFNLVANAVPGTDYPVNAQIPESSIECGSYKQPGYYADTSSPSNCQVFHRCDENGVRTDYLCGNGSLFNQITLVCDWFYNVDCALSGNYADYSNSRIADQNAVLLDNQDEVQAPSGAATNAPRAPGRGQGAGIRIGGSAASSGSSQTSEEEASVSDAAQA